MSHGSSRFSLVLCAACVSCAARAPALVRGAPSATNERRPPGILEVRSVQLPDPVRRGDSQEQLLLLRAPAGADRARETVREFMRAAIAEKPEQLELLLSPNAFVDNGAGRQPARPFWQVRMAQLDYTELKGQVLFREADVQTFRAEDLLRLPRGRRIPLELGADEVAVRVPIRVSWAGRTRLFGDELLFRLQLTGTRFEIAEISEDFKLP